MGENCVYFYKTMSNQNLNKKRRAGRLAARRNFVQKRQAVIQRVTKPNNILTGLTEIEVRKVFQPKILPRLRYVPESVLVDLVFPDVTYNRNNVGSSFLSWRYRANSIYDPDPALGTGSVPGYTFWSGAYNNYLVIGLGYDIQVSNMESSPVDIVSWPSNNDLGLNYAGVSEMFGNPQASVNQIASKGGMDRAHLTGYIDLGKFSGNPTQYIANYFGLFGSNPASMPYFNIGGNCATAFTASNGLDIRVCLTYRVLMYNRKTQVS